MAYLFPYAGSERKPMLMQKPVARVPKRAPPGKRALAKQFKALKELDKSSEGVRVDNRPVELPMMPESLRKILMEVSQHHNVHPNDIAGINRAVKYVNARRHYIVRARNETDHSLPRIGRSIRKDHTTVLHNYNQWLKEGEKTIEVWKPPERTVPPGPKRREGITERETQVIDMHNNGMDWNAIAAELGLRAKTVYGYWRDGNKKLAKLNEAISAAEGSDGESSSSVHQMDLAPSERGYVGSGEPAEAVRSQCEYDTEVA